MGLEVTPMLVDVNILSLREREAPSSECGHSI